MGLKSAQVRDFQSIKDSSVDFGDFTVLVGPSSSGKSAFLRGVRACIRNNFTPSMVRNGAQKSLVSIEFDDGVEVAIERGKSLSTYVLGKGEQKFTKSARAVPPEIEKALALNLIEGVDATMLFQFDKPFLLALSGAQAAQVIGSLTNASLLHAAVREANRRSQEASGVLKVRRMDLDKMREQAKQFTGLKERGDAVTEAESLVDGARVLERRVDQLRQAADRFRSATESLKTLEAVQPVDPASALDAATQSLRRLNLLRVAVAQVRSLTVELRDMVQTADELRAVAVALEEEHAQYLKSLGVCPTCGQDTHG